MREEPDLKTRLSWVKDEAELPGFEQQMRDQGNYDNRAANLIEMRRDEIRRSKGWKSPPKR